MASMTRAVAPSRLRAWRAVDLRWLAVCVIGAIVSGVAAWAVVVGWVPLDVVPADTLFGIACGILVAEWFFAAMLVAIYPDRRAAHAQHPEPTPTDATPSDHAAIEPAPVKPARAEVARAEPARVEPGRAEISRAEPAAAKPAPSEPAPAKPARKGRAAIEQTQVIELPAALMEPAPQTGLALVVTKSAPKPEVDALQERIESLTAALTLTTAAENLEQVGSIAQQALAADIQQASRG